MAATDDTANPGTPATPESATEAEPQSPDSPADPIPAAAASSEEKKWPGWPGNNVYRLIVPVAKVGGIIGRKGDLIKKLCEDTRARVRVLDGSHGSADRIVLVSGKEEPEAEVSPAMDAVLRIFKRTTGLTEADGSAAVSGPPAACSVRLLVASSQAINLIGKQGSLIKSIQESSGATVRVLTGDELPFYATADERVIDIQGEPLKVLKALEAVVGHLRKFLVDPSVLPLFEKNLVVPAATQERPADPWGDKTHSLIHTAQQTNTGNDYPLPSKRDSIYVDRESQFDPHVPHSGLSLYGQDPGLSGLRTAGVGRSAGGLLTQITQTMQIPLSYAEDIIGVAGRNIAYIRQSSGAVVTIHESRGNPDEITVEIKGSSSQVQTAQQLIEDYVNKGPVGSSYLGAEPGMRSSYYGSTGYSSSSLAEPPRGGGYMSSGLGSYSSYRY